MDRRISFFYTAGYVLTTREQLNGSHLKQYDQASKKISGVYLIGISEVVYLGV